MKAGRVRLFVFVTGISILLNSCALIQARRIERINNMPEKKASILAEERQERLLQQEKEDEAYYTQELKRHFNQQSRTTLKSMKKNYVRSRKINRHRKRPFWERLFDKGCR